VDWSDEVKQKAKPNLRPTEYFGVVTQLSD
jgi:hypothetical protein